MSFLNKKLINIIFRLRRFILPTSVIAVVLIGVFVLVNPAQAAFTDLIMEGFGAICQAIVWFLGQVMLMVVDVLINVAQYNDFISEPAVGNGWVIVRDICNMFFIAVLILMAFGTIIPGLGNFTVKGGNLTKLLITAILINFSRTICGLLIDLSQVVMLTFVSGFKDAAGGNFVEALGMTEIMQTNLSSQKPISIAAIVVAYLLAITMTAIALFTVTVIAVSLVVRIIYLWLLVILSPLAFFSRAVPAGFAGGMYAKWWSKFIEFLVGGPLQAFFLWLALVSVQSGGFTVAGEADTSEAVASGITEAFKSASLQKFIIAVCLLLIGNALAKEVAGSATGAGFKFANWAKGKAQRAGLGAARLAGRGGKALGLGALGMAGRGADKLSTKIPLVRGTYDKQLGRHLSASERVKAFGGRIATKAPFVGTDSKAKKELAKMNSQAATLAAANKPAEAAKLRNQAGSLGAALMAKKHGKNTSAMRNIMDGLSADGTGTSTATDQKYAMLALAKQGDGHIKGQGKDFLKNKVSEVSGMEDNPELLKQVTDSLKANGDKRVETSSKDVTDILDKEAKHQVPFIRGGKMEVNEAGKMTDPLYADYLKKMDGDDFKQFKPKIQDKIQDDYVQGIAALKSVGDEEGAKALADKLGDAIDKRFGNVNAKDFEAMGADKRSAISDQMMVASQAMGDSGNDKGANRAMMKRAQMLDQQGQLNAMANESANGSSEAAGMMAESYMNFGDGNQLMAMTKAQHDGTDAAAQKKAEEELAATWRVLNKSKSSMAGAVNSKYQELSGQGALGTAGFTGASTLSAWESDGASDWGAAQNRKQSLYEAASAKAGIKREEAVDRGEAEESEMDKATAGAVSSSKKAVSAVRGSISEIQDIMDQLNEPGAKMNAGIVDKIKDIDKKLNTSIQATSSVFDKMGNETKQPFSHSSSSKALGKAAATGDAATAAAQLSTVANRLNNYVSGASYRDKRTAYSRDKEGKSGLSSSGSKLESALGKADSGERTKGVRRAASGALGTIRIIEKGQKKGTTSPMTSKEKVELGKLKQELKKLKKVGDVDLKQTKEIKEIITKMSNISKRK